MGEPRFPSGNQVRNYTLAAEDPKEPTYGDLVFDFFGGLVSESRDLVSGGLEVLYHQICSWLRTHPLGV